MLVVPCIKTWSDQSLNTFLYGTGRVGKSNQIRLLYRGFHWSHQPALVRLEYYLKRDPSQAFFFASQLHPCISHLSITEIAGLELALWDIRASIGPNLKGFGGLVCEAWPLRLKFNLAASNQSSGCPLRTTERRNVKRPSSCKQTVSFCDCF